MLWFLGPARRDAQRIADEFMLYRSILLECQCCNVLSEKIRRRNNDLYYVDYMKKICSWFNIERDFVYYAYFNLAVESKKLVAVGQRNSCGIILTSGDDDYKIGVSLMSPAQAMQEVAKLYKALLLLSQFWDPNNPRSATGKFDLLGSSAEP